MYFSNPYIKGRIMILTALLSAISKNLCPAYLKAPVKYNLRPAYLEALAIYTNKTYELCSSLPTRKEWAEATQLYGYLAFSEKFFAKPEKQVVEVMIFAFIAISR